jgi:hypothetical protein
MIRQIIRGYEIGHTEDSFQVSFLDDDDDDSKQETRVGLIKGTSLRTICVYFILFGID